MTFRKALGLEHSYVGTERILLALLEHEAGVDKEATELSIDSILATLQLESTPTDTDLSD
ncbi:Clp protease N-terminal domain-containing protein [Nocardioides sp.]|uniref:Clp protease N-terminal domain-containing protein n=1 Tax=Nocardioides sp. TaxID=35761 RepID=UPI0034515A7E